MARGFGILMPGIVGFLMDSGIVFAFYKAAGVGEIGVEDKEVCLFGNKGDCPLT